MPCATRFSRTALGRVFLMVPLVAAPSPPMPLAIAPTPSLLASVASFFFATAFPATAIGVLPAPRTVIVSVMKGIISPAIAPAIPLAVYWRFDHSMNFMTRRRSSLLATPRSYLSAESISWMTSCASSPMPTNGIWLHRLLSWPVTLVLAASQNPTSSVLREAYSARYASSFVRLRLTFLSASRSSSCLARARRRCAMASSCC